jgi:hypothetical protein
VPDQHWAAMQTISEFKNCRKIAMRTNAKKSIGWMIVLVMFGLIALYGGEKWLVVLIPAAMLVWYGTIPTLKSGRN